MEGQTDRQTDGWVITLQGWGDGVGRSEGPADSGTDSCAVQGAATFMRPERTTGLGTRLHHGTNIRQSDLLVNLSSDELTGVFCVM